MAELAFLRGETRHKTHIFDGMRYEEKNAEMQNGAKSPGGMVTPGMPAPQEERTQHW